LTQGLVLEKGLFKDRNLNANGTRTGNISGELAILFGDEMKMKALGSWMFRHFAMEHFLCFVEMAQFKERVISIVQQQNGQFDQERVVRHRHRFYGHCPKSSIVFSGPSGVTLDGGVKGTAGGVVVEMAGIKEEDGDEDVVVVFEEERKEEEATSQVTGAVAVDNETSGISTVDQPSTPRLNVANILDPNNQLNRDQVMDIVLDEEVVRSLKQSAHLLFNKYLENGAALEINISFELRMHYNALDKVEYVSLRPMEWIQLYDDALAVLENYIVESYHCMILKLLDLEKLEREQLGGK